MSQKTGFYRKREAGSELGTEYVTVGCNTPGDAFENLEFVVAPAYGSNLCRFSVNGSNIIDFDAKLLENKDYTGTPVLYPTPNRVRNAMFAYGGRLYNQIKDGEPVFEHGLVHSSPWNCGEVIISDTQAQLATWIDFDESSILFEAFPFKHRLQLEYRLSQESLGICYTIVNHDSVDIPFGFGLHPYFSKLSGDRDTFIRLPAGSVMDYTSDLLPTGRLIAVAGTVYDLRKPVNIGSLDMDHVFTDILPGEFAEIEYRTRGIKVLVQASEDFSHMVLYSPRGMKYFCLENQTCSSDAHNLYDRGFKKQSGLKFVPAGDSASGYVKYRIMEGV